MSNRSTHICALTPFAGADAVLKEAYRFEERNGHDHRVSGAARALPSLSYGGQVSHPGAT